MKVIYLYLVRVFLGFKSAVVSIAAIKTIYSYPTERNVVLQVHFSQLSQYPPDGEVGCHFMDSLSILLKN